MRRRDARGRASVRAGVVRGARLDEGSVDAMNGLPLLAVTAALILGYANGANDVSKTVATLVGSRVATYRQGIIWGTLWTGVGAALAGWLAPAMLATFVSGWFIGHAATGPAFALAAAFGAIGWVSVSTHRGLPVSTTHAITGAIVGLGVSVVGFSAIAWAKLVTKIVIPLAFSPLFALVLAWLVLPVFQKLVSRERELVLCVAVRQPSVQPAMALAGPRFEMAAQQAIGVPAASPSGELCVYVPTFLRVNADRLHWVSSAAIAFARALNDTPKVAAIAVLMLLANPGGKIPAMIFPAIAASMAMGSLLGGRRVTQCMAECITRLDEPSGLAANLLTATLVAGAANLGLPVSTTHVSNGAIVGVGLARGTRAVSWRTIRDFIMAWMVTLPASAGLAIAVYALLHMVGGLRP